MFCCAFIDNDQCLEAQQLSRNFNCVTIITRDIFHTLLVVKCNVRLVSNLLPTSFSVPERFVYIIIYLCVVSCLESWQRFVWFLSWQRFRLQRLQGKVLKTFFVSYSVRLSSVNGCQFACKIFFFFKLVLWCEGDRLDPLLTYVKAMRSHQEAVHVFLEDAKGMADKT